MDTAERTSPARFQRLDQWWVPFSWVLIAPMLLKPLSFAFLYLLTDFQAPGSVGLPEPGPMATGSSDPPTSYEYFLAVPTIIIFISVGLLNLAPFLWILSKQTEVRIAGIFAGLFGLLQLSIPIPLSFYVFERFTNPDGVLYFRNLTVFWSDIQLLHLSWAIAGAIAWYVSATAWWVFGRARNKSSEPRQRVAEYGMGAFALAGVTFGVMLAFFIHF